MFLNGTSSGSLLGRGVAVLTRCIILIANIVDRPRVASTVVLVWAILDVAADELDIFVDTAEIAAISRVISAVTGILRSFQAHVPASLIGLPHPRL